MQQSVECFLTFGNDIFTLIACKLSEHAAASAAQQPLSEIYMHKPSVKHYKHSILNKSRKAKWA